jgi:hypothetical protein
MPGFGKRVITLWRVVVDAHTVARYEVEALDIKLGGPDASYARLSAIREAHRRAGMPPWKPYVRESWQHSRATRETVEVNG